MNAETHVPGWGGYCLDTRHLSPAHVTLAGL